MEEALLQKVFQEAPGRIGTDRLFLGRLEERRKGKGRRKHLIKPLDSRRRRGIGRRFRRVEGSQQIVDESGMGERPTERLILLAGPIALILEHVGSRVGGCPVSLQMRDPLALPMGGRWRRWG